MTTEMYKYTLDQFHQISFNDFHYELQECVLSKISEIALEVGSPQYIKTPVFKKEMPKNDLTRNNNNKGKKKYKNGDTLDSEWPGSIKAPASHPILHSVEKSNVDVIMLLLNKLTPTTYEASLVKIKSVISNLIDNENENEVTKLAEINKISNVIFDVVSNNIFYSQVYAKLFAVLVNDYEVIKTTFEVNFANFINLFNIIEHADPNTDYDRFCEINKTNNKRKALSTFFINLMDNKVIAVDKIKEIFKILVCTMRTFILEADRKSEVDELIENIAILYRKDLFGKSNTELYAELGNTSMIDFITALARSKVADYKSLTNKTIFKCMDLIEM